MRNSVTVNYLHYIKIAEWVTITITIPIIITITICIDIVYILSSMSNWESM